MRIDNQAAPFFNWKPKGPKSFWRKASAFSGRVFQGAGRARQGYRSFLQENPEQGKRLDEFAAIWQLKKRQQEKTNVMAKLAR